MQNGRRVCSIHGGQLPQVRAAVNRNLAEQKARREVEVMAVKTGISPVGNPVAVLMEIAGEAVAFKDVLAEHVRKLHDMRFTDDHSAEQARTELLAYERALDRAEKFCHNLAKLDLAERMVKVETAQVALTAAALDGALAAAGITGEQKRAILADLARRLGA